MPYTTLTLYRLSTVQPLSDSERLTALREYRSTGGITDVVFTEPDPSDLSAEHCEALSEAGPSVDEIDWTGFPEDDEVAP